MLHNNYQSRNLIGHYPFWVISPRNSTSFTRPFLAGRRAWAGHETMCVLSGQYVCWGVPIMENELHPLSLVAQLAFYYHDICLSLPLSWCSAVFIVRSSGYGNPKPSPLYCTMRCYIMLFTVVGSSVCTD